MTRYASSAPPAAPEPEISALAQAGGVVGLLGGVALVGLAGWLTRRRPGWLVLASASLSALAGVFWIFRNPDRSSPAAPDAVVAPCDGDVLAISQVHEPRLLKGPAHRITLRVRPGDVQILRAPLAGSVRLRRYVTAGQSGEDSDALWLGIRQPAGGAVLLKLGVSSFWRAMPSYVGRRITALIDLEDAVGQGQVCGHLPLGGEAQVFIPSTAQVKVTASTRVRAGETILAQI